MRKVRFGGEYKGYARAIERKGYNANPDQTVVLERSLEPFADRKGASLFWTFGSLGIVTIAIFMFFSPINNSQIKNVIKGKDGNLKDLADEWSFLVPNRDYFITPMLGMANVLIFLAMVFAGVNLVSPYPFELVAWGGNIKNLVIENHEWWRLLTAVFLLSSLMHILGNLFALFLIGAILEERLGPWLYLILYLVVVVAASRVSLYFSDGGVSVGASGAIFGLYGIAIALTITRKLELETRNLVFVLSFIIVGLNLVLGFIQEGIDNAGHIGGLSAGFLVGLILPLRRAETYRTVMFK